MTALKRNMRLSGAQAVKETSRKGRRAEKNGFIVHILENEDGHAKATVNVSKRVSKKAVVRNRIKRVLSEALRSVLSEKQNLPFNILIRAKPGAEKINFHEMKKDIEDILDAFKRRKNRQK